MSPLLLRRSTVEQAMRAVGPARVVAASPYCATPTTLLSGLARRSHDVPGLVLSAGLLFGELPFFDEVLTGQMFFRTWHLSGSGRRLAAAGAVDYVPARARDAAEHLLSRVDVALVRVSPPDSRGNCSLGTSASYTKDMLEAAHLRIAEIDPEMPRTLGDDVTYPSAAFDHVVDAETPICTYASPEPSPESQEIARLVASLINDGTTLQLGIGGIPEVVARVLSTSNVRDLRIVGLLTDSMVGLSESGQVADAPDAMRVAELLGSRRVFDFAHENPAVRMLSSRSIHDPTWLARQRGFVSVCSALEVDLTGQVASEEVAGRSVAGVGGSVDFFEGANLSPGGIRIVALPSVRPSGAARIRSEFAPGTPVTLARHSVDYVVTEHGIAHLTGRSVRERAEALVAVAHPAHRDTLYSHIPPRTQTREHR